MRDVSPMLARAGDGEEGAVGQREHVGADAAGRRGLEAEHVGDEARHLRPPVGGAAGEHEPEDLHGLALPDPAQHRLEVEHRRPVERLEVAHATRGAVDRDDLDEVEADRVGAVRRARVEDALLGVAQVAARMDPQHVATRAVEPGEDDHLVPGPDAVEPSATFGAEHQPCVRRSLVALLGGRGPVGEGRFDGPDRDQLIHAAAA